MDNASKALVMVGAILIAVMLISLGVFLFTYARDAAEDQTDRMDELTVSAFNQQFNSYLGSNIKGTSVKALIQTAKAAKVTVYSTDASTALKAGNIDSKAEYQLKEAYDGNGRISSIQVKIKAVAANGAESWNTF